MIHPRASTIPSGFASHALQLLDKVQRGISPVELVYVAHQRWPFRPGQTVHASPMLHISVLDASFNPPTLAHLALANSLPPMPVFPYDAHLLLLSVRNADKSLRQRDATFIQRLEMMHLLSHNVRSTNIAESCGEPPQTKGNVAVGIIDEPTFVGKSTLLLRFLRTRLVTAVESSHFPSNTSDERAFPSPKLTFLMGSDTLVRLFSPRYYPSEQAMIQMLRTCLSPDQEDCRIVCAHRGNANTDETFKMAHEFITSCHIAFIDIGGEQAHSSSEVRAKIAVGDGTWKRLVTNAIANYITRLAVYSSSEGTVK